jgi:hypothetical protein
MGLEDKMLEAILRAILRKPERCPSKLVTAAQVYNERKSPEDCPIYYIGEWDAKECFQAELDRNWADLPAMLDF